MFIPEEFPTKVFPEYLTFLGQESEQLKNRNSGGFDLQLNSSVPLGTEFLINSVQNFC
jgi:hypothetical protein